ncbi:MAG: ArnT family glycosyltransferase [Patescibacteria group bacterium]
MNRCRDRERFRNVWEPLSLDDQNGGERRGEGFMEWVSDFFREDGYLFVVVIFAGFLSFASFAYFYSNDLTLLNSDAIAHLLIAKRVLDGLTPGLAHLGGYWLPLPHILMLPFVWSDFLFRTGLAGSFLSMISFVLTAVFIYKLTSLTVGDGRVGLFAAVVFCGNPNVLYMQAIPMTEMVFLFFMVAAVYYLSKWGKNADDLLCLVLAAAMIASATLTRYEGWALFLLSLLMVLYVCVRKGFFAEKVQAYLIYFGSLAGLGILLWLIWEQTILGDFLFFHRGEYSNLSFTVDSELTGDFRLALLSYWKATRMIVGSIALAMSLLGVIYFAFTNRLKINSLCLLVLFFPFPFFVYSLYSGQVEQKLPGLGNGGMYCIRYGLLMVPAVAIFIAFLLRNRWLQILVVLVLLVNSFFMVRNGNIVTLNESAVTGIGPDGVSKMEGGLWLRENYDYGLTLVENKEHEPLVFWSSIPIDSFIYEGDRGYWEEALTDPEKHARWIVMSKWPDGPDKVWKALHGTDILKGAFDCVYRISTSSRTTEFYKLNEGVSEVSHEPSNISK